MPSTNHVRQPCSQEIRRGARSRAPGLEPVAHLHVRGAGTRRRPRRDRAAPQPARRQPGAQAAGAGGGRGAALPPQRRVPPHQPGRGNLSPGARNVRHGGARRGSRHPGRGRYRGHLAAAGDEQDPEHGLRRFPGALPPPLSQGGVLRRRHAKRRHSRRAGQAGAGAGTVPVPQGHRHAGTAPVPAPSLRGGVRPPPSLLLAPQRARRGPDGPELRLLRQRPAGRHARR